MQFAAIAVMACLAFAFFGWGSGFRRLFRMGAGIAPVTIVIGLAVVVCLGGLLNLVDLAYPAALAIVIAVGAALAVKALLADPPRCDDWSPAWLAVAVPVVAVFFFTVVTQLPPAAYNHHDDFQKYFAFAARMLATGTVSGSTLNAMGGETLGGMAWLDGFSLAILPLPYINIIDAVFGLLLCMVLAGWLAGGRLAAASALCVLGVAFINPQYVNTSALYLGAVLMMAAVALCTDERETPKPVALALIYAALIAIKTTFALFAGFHLVLAAAMIAIHQRSPSKGLRWAVVCLGFSVCFLAPWILVHASNYWTALTAPPVDVINATPQTEDIDLFSAHPNNYDTTNLVYTIAILVPAVVAAWVAWRARQADDRTRLSTLMAVAAAGTAIGSYVILMEVLAPKLSGAFTSLRYFAPYAIGIVPALGGVIALLMSRIGKGQWFKTLVPLVLCILPLLLFADSFVTRADQAWNSGTILAFRGPSKKPAFRNYNTTVLYGDMKQKVAALQAKVPEGEPVVAWVGAPFYLDFNRNPITDVNIAGLETPWAELPSRGYVIWEYNGPATPALYPEDKDITLPGEREWMIQARAARFARRLEQMVQSGEPLYTDEQFVIFRLPG